MRARRRGRAAAWNAEAAGSAATERMTAAAVILQRVFAIAIAGASLWRFSKVDVTCEWMSTLEITTFDVCAL